MGVVVSNNLKNKYKKLSAKKMTKKIAKKICPICSNIVFYKYKTKDLYIINFCRLCFKKKIKSLKIEYDRNS